MYCTTCGKELPDGSSVCDECGTRFTPDGKPAETPHRPYMDDEPFSGRSEESAPSFRDYPPESPPFRRQNPYGQMPDRNYEEGPDRTGMAVAALVLGIVAVCSCCLPILNIPLGILGLIFSILGMKSSYRGLAVAGLVLSIIALVLGLMILLIVLLEDGFHVSYYW